MKNKLVLLVTGCILPITLAGAWKQTDKADAGSTYKKVGTILENELQENQNHIVVEGRNIKVSQKEVDIRCELSKYGGNVVSQEEAMQELIEEKALYEEAVRQGFQLSDAELDREMAELKEVVKTSENSEEIQEMIGAFENEDVYWEYVRERNLVKGTILAYQQSLKEKYCDKTGVGLENDIEKKEVQGNRILTAEEKKKEMIKILDYDGTLDLEIIEEGDVEDGEYIITTASYKVDSEEKNKILWERLKKYRKQLDMLEESADSGSTVEVGTSKRIR